MKLHYFTRNEISTIWLSIIILFGYTNQINCQTKNTVVVGEIINISDPVELPDLQIVLQSNPFILSGKWEYISYDKNGKFKIEFPLLFPHELMFLFNTFFEVYAFPGDTINLTIDANILNTELNNVKSNYEHLDIQCPNQEFQDEFTGFYISLHDSPEGKEISDPQSERAAFKDFSPFEFKVYTREKSKKKQKLLKKYIQENEISDEFASWASDWIYASEIHTLLRYSWFHNHLNNIDNDTDYCLSEEYFIFLKSDKFNNDNLLMSNEYAYFLHELSVYNHVFFHRNNRELLDSLREAKDIIEINRIYQKHFVQNYSGFLQHYLISKIYCELLENNLIDVFEALYNSDLISRKDFIQVIEQEYTALSNHVINPVYTKDVVLNASSGNVNNSIFSKLPEKYAGKVIYIDFWAPWCSPCRSEMPNSITLQKKFKEEDLIFVYLASSCTEKSWKASISIMQLTGEHFLLSDEEYKLLSDKFEIGGIPRYMIIDKNGVVINDNAPRPSDDSLEEILHSLIKNESNPIKKI